MERWLWMRALTLTVLAAAWLIPAGAAPALAQEKKVTIRLSWKIKGEFAPLYVGVDKGIFKRHGISAEVLEGAGAVPAAQSVAGGKDDFAYIGAVETVQAVGQGMPVKMVGQYLKQMPIALATYPELTLKSPKDLEGRSIATTPADSFNRIFPALAKTHNVDTAKVRIVSVDPGARMGLFLQKQADVLSTYLTNDVPVVEDKLGIKLNVVMLNAWGYNLLGHGLVASVDRLKGDPDTIRKVVAATTEAWQYTIEHPDEAADIVVKRFKEFVKKGVVLEQIRLTNTLVTSEASKGRPLGWSASQDWEPMVSLMAGAGLVKEKKPLDAYYTNEFVPSR